MMKKWTKKQYNMWDKWVASRPKIIQKLAKKFPPNQLYRLKPGNERVFPVSYCENNTMTVQIVSKYNPHIFFERNVFGIKPSDLKSIGKKDSKND